LFCAILSWWGAPSASRIDGALYFIFSFISYVCVAYFVTALLRRHSTAIDNLSSFAEDRTKDRQTELSGMLITAQERERSRLASEIHDDFSQRLALIALELENVEETIGTSSDEAVRQVHNILNYASELGADLHTLSHRLHSSTLERLGLVPGTTALCKEFAVQQGVEVDFLTDDVPRSVHPDVALCLFRIVQEGLRNLKKHSGATKAQVRLCKIGDKLHVSVSDKGIGFDLRDQEGKEGLGIRSMEERAYLLGGRFEIHSKPGKGTRIEAVVPLDPKTEVPTG
jgi:signal transduction histidine kinase